ncbi:MAG: hypothetical protein Ct9H90mP25_4210 [Gammaproteobacteria bacterium]|nr:MAG: hypothetical protein Ct9H90mP25_4210 [Gammaproteobacteria bacterium]
MLGFLMVNIAAAFKVSGGNVLTQNSRGCSPNDTTRLTNVENAIQGQPKNEQTAQSVMQMATDGARA